MKFTGPNTAEVLADECLPDDELRAELLAAVRERFPEANRITGWVTLDRPLDTSREPHRRWFQVSYQ